MDVLLIDDVRIGNGYPAAVVAEIGSNHDGDKEQASKLLKMISKTSTKIVKFQYFTTNELIADRERIVSWGPPEQRVNEKIGEMFDRLSLSPHTLKDLFAEARDHNLIPIATPFSEKGVDFLMSLDIACFKIAASDVTHIKFLEYIAKTNKPIILSLGKCTLGEADEAINAIFDSGCKSLGVLHCVSSYPSPMEEMNLNTIPLLNKLYPECCVGLSDHSHGINASIAAIAIGARIIEKHVTYDQEIKGPDHWFSINMNQLQELVKASKDLNAAMKGHRRGLLKCETEGKIKATRSIYSNRPLKAGTVLTIEDIKVVRPSDGLKPKYIDDILGLKLRKNIEENAPITWELFMQ